MAYQRLSEPQLRAFIETVMEKYGFTGKQAKDIADVVLTADLQGLESHGIQRLIRYHNGILSGAIDPTATPVVEFETPVSAVINANGAMGQITAVFAMEQAIAKAKQTGFGAAVVHNTNHFGVGGYYTNMAAKEEMIGLCFTNTEAISVPTFGKKAMLGTNPIAFSMPADPIPLMYDVATTVVPRGKLEVYAKQGKPMPLGWAVDENGNDTTDAARVLENIKNKAGGGILPLGGSGPVTGSHKGYGTMLLVEIMSSIIAGGHTSNHVARNGSGDTSQSFFAIDYGMFGDKAKQKADLSTLLQELRESPKADGRERIFTPGEMEMESRADKLKNGIPASDATMEELRGIAAHFGMDFDALVPVIG
ncbi:MAG: Ldh family oxidoreductase [Ruminococcaceae bacterium]|nr:Ldh family oxidoreductase [Oscillospiraceae bacterium]